MVYTIIENPPPGKRENSTTTTQSFNDDPETLNNFRLNNTTSTDLLKSTSRTQPYVIIADQPSAPTIIQKSTPTVIQPIVLNNNVNITNNLPSGNLVISARYENTGTINSITTKTLLTNNGLGSRTQDSNTPKLWTSSASIINVQSANEIIEVQIRFTASTNTLGGAFELELQSVLNSFVIDKQELNINIQDQDYTVIYKVLTTTQEVSGIRIYITPELGMTLNLSDIEFIFIKSFTT